MLTNRWFIAAVAVLLAGAVVFDVWFFFLRDDDGAPGGGAPPAQVADGADGTPAAGEGEAAAGAPDGLTGLFAAAAESRPPLRSAAELRTLRAWMEEVPEWGREPLSRPEREAPDREETSSQAPTPPDWRVTAILVGGGRRTAVIDGQVYSEGDEIDGGVVEEIRERAVTIRWRGRRVEVPLRQPF